MACTKIYRLAFEIYQKHVTVLQDKQGLQDARNPDNHVNPVSRPTALPQKSVSHLDRVSTGSDSDLVTPWGVKNH